MLACLEVHKWRWLLAWSSTHTGPRPTQHNHWLTHESCAESQRVAPVTKLIPPGEPKNGQKLRLMNIPAQSVTFSVFSPPQQSRRVTELRSPADQLTKYYKFVASAAQTTQFFYCQTGILNRYFPVPPSCTFTSSRLCTERKLFRWFLFENISYDTVCRHA